jgi:LacI family transcriptional regulator
VGTRVTLRDIAQRVGLSTSAVSLIARGDGGVAESTRERVLQVMREVGYAPRPARNGQRGAAAQALALVVERLPLPVLADAAYAEVAGGMQAAARSRGFLLALHELESPTDLGTILGDPERCAGLLLLGSGDLTDDAVRRLLQRVPAVLVDNHLLGHPAECVLPDHATAGFLATEHLAALGHRRIAFLPGPRKYNTLADRLQGFLGAMALRGLPVPPDLLPPPVGGTPRKGYHQMKQLLGLPHPPTAVVATSDKSALGALEALREAGRRVPQDVALVGIDDIADAAHTDPPLTTVHWPKRELGMLAVQRLLERIERPDAVPVKTLVPCSLVVRDSCGGRR